MLVHRRATPSIKFASIHLYTSVERGTGDIGEDQKMMYVERTTVEIMWFL